MVGDISEGCFSLKLDGAFWNGEGRLGARISLSPVVIFELQVSGGPLRGEEGTAPHTPLLLSNGTKLTAVQKTRKPLSGFKDRSHHPLCQKGTQGIRDLTINFLN